jgi:hypothetical protein
MPNISASDYTTFVKLQAASLAYQNGKIPVPIQRVYQPVPSQSILNAQLLASQAAGLVTPKNATIVLQNGVIGRVRPFAGKGYVNNPDALSTVGGSAVGSSKFQQVGGLPQTAPRGSGIYAPVTQLARVDTKATGKYKTPGTRTFT